MCKNTRYPKTGCGLHQQQGIATILLVVLIGMALIATTFGLTHSLRSTQEKQVAAHAVTHAQNGVWTGVEAFRRYLGSIEEGSVLAALDDVNGTVYSIDLSDANGAVQDYGTITVSDVAVSSPINGVYQVSATIANVHAQAKASASVGAVFQVNPDACITCVTLSTALNFHDDLTATGQVNIDSTQKINVDGNVTFDDINISALESLNATGNIHLNSGVQVELIHANGEVKIEGGATIAEIKTKGNVITSGGATIDFIEADGTVDLGASGRTLSVDSLSTITAKAGGGNHALLRTGGTVVVERFIDDRNREVKYGNTITDLYSVDLIDVQSDTATVNHIYGENNLKCPAAQWTNYTTVHLAGTLDDTCTHQKARLDNMDPSIVVPTEVTVEVMNPVPEFALPSLRIDVFKLRPDANYVVEYDSGRITVTINNINGETNGTVYQLGNYDGNVQKPDALCNSVDDAGNCTCSSKVEGVCQDPEKYLCLGSSANMSCIDYSNGTFTVEGTGVAPGIYWFDGNVTVATGFNNATMLVTGNIFSSGQYRGAAVNYGYEPTLYSIGNRDTSLRTTPYQEICLVEATGLREAMSHMVPEYQRRFAQRYPSSLCDLNGGTYTSLPTGNLALAAGGIRPTDEGGDGIYRGGDIEIGSNSQIYGITMAGGYLKSGGGSTFFGYVAAAVQGTKRSAGTTKNELNGTANFIFNTRSTYYQPDSTTDMAPPPANGGENFSERSRLIWSKYM